VRPLGASLAVHGSYVFISRHFGLLLARLGCEILLSSGLVLPFLAADNLIQARPQYWQAWVLAVIMGIAGISLWFVLRLVIRAGTFRVAYDRLTGTTSSSILIRGSEVLPQALASAATLFILDALLVGCLILVATLSFPIVKMHPFFGAFVVAGMWMTIFSFCVIVSGFSSLALALAMLDGTTIAQAWLRLRRVIYSMSEGPQRTLVLAILIFFGTILISAIEVVSSELGSFGESSLSLPLWLLMVPIFTLFYEVLVDIAGLFFVLSCTERLPFGIATPANLSSSST